MIVMIALTSEQIGVEKRGGKIQKKINCRA